MKKPITIRLDVSLVKWFKKEAKRTGVPYQVLIRSVLHMYSKGLK